MFPYIEQNTLYEEIISGQDHLSQSGLARMVVGDRWWNVMTNDTERAKYGNVAIYFCPVLPRSRPAVSNTSSDSGGPQHDYAMVTRQAAGDTTPWWRFADVNAYDHSSPFRQAMYTGLTSNHNSIPTDISFRDDIAWWQDGTSNQLCIGEKHFTTSPKFMPGYYDGSNHTDGSYFTAKAGGLFVSPVVRTFDGNYAFIARAWETMPASMDDGTSNFGSWHTGTGNFLIGDGSVRGISNTTSGNILQALAGVKDGQTVNLP
jgi:hypothetical protein